MLESHQTCMFCRFLRSLAFSAIGAGVAGYSALFLGLDQRSAMIAAFFGALFLVAWTTPKKDKKGRRDR